MPSRPKPLQAFLTSSLCFTILVLVFASQRSASAQDEWCIGKPYPTQGCPVLTDSASSTAPKSTAPDAVCGNNIVEGGEDCDMGRFNGQRNCSEQCQWLYCGDGIVSPSNLVNGKPEECEPTLARYYGQNPKTRELAIVRKFTEGTCGQVCTIPTCDGEGKNCTGGCKQKFLPSCHTAASAPAVSANPSAAAQASSAPEAAASQNQLQSGPRGRCGNSILEQGEQCDDGNLVHTDSCSNLCQPARCGDAIVQSGEACDDGNQINGDTCSNLCQSSRCGDSIVQMGEQCDDGNPSNTDACTTNCQFSRCGDSIVQIGESCDDGNSVNTDACTNTCKAPTCGDGIIQYGEDCDDGNQNNADGCSNSCQNAHCGDRIVQLGEQCDDGNENNGDTCTNTCRKATCGDGIVQTGEQCDDGNQISTDACTTLCQLARCGNGVREASEECDDGNEVGTDGCSTSCKLPVCGNSVREEGEECDAGSKNSPVKPNACRDDCQLAHCGDGVIDTGEECDGSDGCTSQCTIAPLSGGRTRMMFVSIASAGTVLLFVILGIIFRTQIAEFLRKSGKGKSGMGGKGALRSIDDIPLDEIEMPWHSW